MRWNFLTHRLSRDLGASSQSRPSLLLCSRKRWVQVGGRVNLSPDKSRMPEGGSTENGIQLLYFLRITLPYCPAGNIEAWMAWIWRQGRRNPFLYNCSFDRIDHKYHLGSYPAAIVLFTSQTFQPYHCCDACGRTRSDCNCDSNFDFFIGVTTLSADDLRLAGKSSEKG